MAVYIVVGVFILFDIATGVLKAVYHGNVDSTALRKGMYHKLSEVITVIGSGLIEYGASYINLGVSLPVLNVVAVYICITELISILENIAEVNPTLSKLFKPYLEKLKEQESQQEKEENEKEDKEQ